MREVWVVLEKSYSDRSLEDVAVVGVYDDEVATEILVAERVSAYMRANPGVKAVHTAPKPGEWVVTFSGADDAPLLTLLRLSRIVNRTTE